MNSNTSAALWPTAIASRSIAASIGNTQSELIADIALAIATAVDGGLFTSSTAVSGETSGDVQYVMALLNQGGYTAVNDGTSIVVTW